jgi:hypothetical protein
MMQLLTIVVIAYFALWAVGYALALTTIGVIHVCDYVKSFLHRD